MENELQTYDVKTLALELLVSPKTVRRLVSEQQIAHHRIRGRIIFSEAQVNEYLDSVVVKTEDKINKYIQVYLNS
jgi:excisionase family DNA binding protein